MPSLLAKVNGSEIQFVEYKRHDVYNCGFKDIVQTSKKYLVNGYCGTALKPKMFHISNK